MKLLRQNDKLFIYLLNKVRVGKIDDGVEKSLKARFTHISNENYSKAALRMHTENTPTMKMYEVVLNDLLGELYTIKANEKFQIFVNTH